jgi:hypothetical protein
MNLSEEQRFKMKEDHHRNMFRIQVLKGLCHYTMEKFDWFLSDFMAKKSRKENKDIKDQLFVGILTNEFFKDMLTYLVDRDKI